MLPKSRTEYFTDYRRVRWNEMTLMAPTRDQWPSLILYKEKDHVRFNLVYTKCIHLNYNKRYNTNLDKDPLLQYYLLGKGTMSQQSCQSLWWVVNIFHHCKSIMCQHSKLTDDDAIMTLILMVSQVWVNKWMMNELWSEHSFVHVNQNQYFIYL